MTALACVFAVSVAAVIYVYAGYPVCLWIASRPRRPYRPAGEALPSISFLTAAHNEEPVIELKIRNCLALDYPPEKIRFLFVSDGSVDRTNEILERYAAEYPDRIRVVISDERGGKMRALKKLFPLCEGEVISLTDANTYYKPDALRKLARHLSDPEVGVVTGDVRILPTEEQFGAGEGVYYRYERALQRMETRLWSAVGVDGAMYILRRELLEPPSDNIILDDFVISMNAARRGARIIYDPEAIAEEDPTPSSGQEFWRKVRVVAGGYQAILQREGLPRLTQARLLWMYLSHKVLRWMAPVFLLAMFGVNAVLAVVGPAWPWGWLLGGQAAFYALALAGWKIPAFDQFVFRIPYYFCMINAAAFLGLIRALRGNQSVLWRKAARVTPAGGGARS